MTRENQLRYARIIIIIAAVIVTLIVIAAAFAEDHDDHPETLNNLSATVMWALGGAACFTLAIAEILRRHENDITRLKSYPPAVSEAICVSNTALLKAELYHGIERVERIEKNLEILAGEMKTQSDRHAEIMSGIHSLLDK